VVVSQQMSMMEPVYSLFEQQMAARELWGETLWKDLNVQILQDGIDGFLNKARKLHKTIRAIPVSLLLPYTSSPISLSISIIVFVSVFTVYFQLLRFLFKEFSVSLFVSDEHVLW